MLGMVLCQARDPIAVKAEGAEKSVNAEHAEAQRSRRAGWLRSRGVSRLLPHTLGLCDLRSPARAALIVGRKRD